MPQPQTLGRAREDGEGGAPSQQEWAFHARRHRLAQWVLLFAALGLSDRAHPQAARDPQSEADLSKLPPSRIAEAGASNALTAGTPVRTPTGETIGSVKDVVPDPSTGQPVFVLVAIGPGANSAIPYPAITFKDSQIVLDRSRLEGAPRVDVRQLHDKADSSWQTAARRYWLDDVRR